MAFEADIGGAGVPRGRHHETEFRLMRGTLYSIFLASAMIGRLLPWTWRAGRPSIFQEAKASTDRITPMVFTG